MRTMSVDSGFREERWVHMMALSFCLHLAVFSTILFIPQTTARYPSFEGGVYHVELVGSPSRVKGGVKGGGIKGGVKGGGISSTVKTRGTSRMVDAGTRRIAVGKKKSAPILARRVSPKARARSGERAFSPSELIDKAISKIERKVERHETVQSEKTENGFEGATAAGSKGEGGVMPGTSSDIGIIIKLYQMEIENTIKNNWSYPVALVDLRRGRIPEAVVVVTVRRDGKILKTWFKRRSNNPLFDESVLKAIEKSDPLPGFPDGYRKRYDEVEINFNLKDLA